MSAGENTLIEIVHDALIIDDCISIMEGIDRLHADGHVDEECSQAIHRVMRTSVERILISVDRHQVEPA